MVKTERRTNVGLAAHALHPLGKLDLVPVDLLSGCLAHVVGDLQEALFPFLAGPPRKQDAALLKGLANGR